jgi:hypothetical protein
MRVRPHAIGGSSNVTDDGDLSEQECVPGCAVARKLPPKNVSFIENPAFNCAMKSHN